MTGCNPPPLGHSFAVDPRKHPGQAGGEVFHLLSNCLARPRLHTRCTILGTVAAFKQPPDQLHQCKWRCCSLRKWILSASGFLVHWADTSWAYIFSEWQSQSAGLTTRPFIQSVNLSETSQLSQRCFLAICQLVGDFSTVTSVLTAEKCVSEISDHFWCC